MTTTKPMYFTITSGLAGCYMPDSVDGPYMVTTRRELVDTFRAALDWNEFPKAKLHDIKWLEVWRHAKRHGLSVLTLSVEHKGRAVTLHGNTLAEYEAEQED